VLGKEKGEEEGEGEMMTGAKVWRHAQPGRRSCPAAEEVRDGRVRLSSLFSTGASWGRRGRARERRARKRTPRVAAAACRSSAGRRATQHARRGASGDRITQPPCLPGGHRATWRLIAGKKPIFWNKDAGRVQRLSCVCVTCMVYKRMPDSLPETRSSLVRTSM